MYCGDHPCQTCAARPLCTTRGAARFAVRDVPPVPQPPCQSRHWVVVNAVYPAYHLRVREEGRGAVLGGADERCRVFDGFACSLEESEGAERSRSQGGLTKRGEEDVTGLLLGWKRRCVLFLSSRRLSRLRSAYFVADRPRELQACPPHLDVASAWLNEEDWGEDVKSRREKDRCALSIRASRASFSSPVSSSYPFCVYSCSKSQPTTKKREKGKKLEV